MNTNRDLDLTTQPIPKLIKKLAIPASVGYFFNTMYNVVDTFFGGLISTQVLAALSLYLPVFFIIIAVGMGISIGTTALIGNALGVGNREEAKLLAIQGVTFGVLMSIALTFIGILFVYIAAMQGVKKPMYAIWIGLYRQIAAPFMLFYLLIQVFEFGLKGIWWGIFAITWSAALFTLFYAHRLLKKVRNQEAEH